MTLFCHKSLFPENTVLKPILLRTEGIQAQDNHSFPMQYVLSLKKGIIFDKIILDLW
jgi:hypothetical protein